MKKIILSLSQKNKQPFYWDQNVFQQIFEISAEVQQIIEVL